MFRMYQPSNFYTYNYVKYFLDSLLSYRLHMNLLEGLTCFTDGPAIDPPIYKCDVLPQMYNINKKKAMRGFFKLYILCLEKCYINRMSKGKFMDTHT